MPIPGISKPTSKTHVIPPRARPSKAAYVQINIGFKEPEKITIKATAKPPNNPIKIRMEASGIEKAVIMAVVAVIKRRIPVFSATPSMDIRLDSSSHQLASL